MKIYNIGLLNLFGNKGDKHEQRQVFKAQYPHDGY
jgi:hypothetical protein